MKTSKAEGEVGETSAPITAIEIRAVSGCYIVNARRQQSASRAAPGGMEESVFKTWNDLVSYLSAEGFI